MFPTLMLCSFAGVTLPDEVVDRLVSKRVVVVERQVMLKFAIFTGDPLGSREAGTIKCLAEPSLSTHHKQTAAFLAGGKGGGIEIKATPQLRLDGKIKLDCETGVHTRNPDRGVQTAAGFVPGVDSLCQHMTVEMKPGHTVKVRLSAKSATDQTWMELSASVVEHPFAAPPPAPARISPPLAPVPVSVPVPPLVTRASYTVPVAPPPSVQTVCPEAMLPPVPAVPARMPAVVPAGGVVK